MFPYKAQFDVFFLSRSFLKTNQIRQANQQIREGNQIEQIQQIICALKLYEFFWLLLSQLKS